MQLADGVMTGDTTIVSDTPVSTAGLTDGPGQKTVVVLSYYAPPPASDCTSSDNSECAIHVRSQFDNSCRTAVLCVAMNAHAALKNNARQCGAVYGENVAFKNNVDLVYDPRIARIVGFGTPTFERVRYEELPP